MLRTAVGAGPYGLSLLPGEAVFKQMLALSGVRQSIDMMGTPASEIWSEVADMKIDMRFGFMKPTEKKKGWLAWAGFGGPTETEQAEVKIGDIKSSVWEDSVAMSSGKFPKAIRDEFAKLKAETVLWSVAKHFPLQWYYKFEYDEMEEAARQEAMLEQQVAYEQTRKEYLTWMLTVPAIDASTRRGDHILFKPETFGMHRAVLDLLSSYPGDHIIYKKK